MSDLYPVLPIVKVERNPEGLGDGAGQITGHSWQFGIVRGILAGPFGLQIWQRPVF